MTIFSKTLSDYFRFCSCAATLYPTLFNFLFFFVRPWSMYKHVGMITQPKRIKPNQTQLNQTVLNQTQSEQIDQTKNLKKIVKNHESKIWE